ncbi:MAG: hypothetical protein AAGH41_13805 [Pseudomonadota bacterium]
MRIARITYAVVVTMYFSFCGLISALIIAGDYSNGSIPLAIAMGLMTVPSGVAGLVVGFAPTGVAQVVLGASTIGLYGAIILIGIRLFRRNG